VIRLYKEGRTVRDIAKQMHMSFGDIVAISREVKAEAEREAGHINEQELDNNDNNDPSRKGHKPSNCFQRVRNL
jgi:hypothetical protein